MPAQLTIISCCGSHEAVYDCLSYTESGEQLVPQMSHNCHTSRNLELQLRKIISFLSGYINRVEYGHIWLGLSMKTLRYGLNMKIFKHGKNKSDMQ